MDNLSLVYNKTMYDHDGEFGTRIDFWVNQIINTEFQQKNFEELSIPEVSRLSLKTVYPGMLMGTGYSHGISSEINSEASEKDIKAGFSFDYVTGIPYIPGSSVKGVIKSIFVHPEVVAEMLKDIGAPLPENSDTAAIVSALTTKIFGDKDIKTDGDGDVFFDAVIKKGDNNNRILSDDYITPHKDAISNPTPIRILKVLPDVEFEFRFKLSETTIPLADESDYKLSIKQKEKLFKKIITEFGIGAKTNVGYGYLVSLTDEIDDGVGEKTFIPEEEKKKIDEKNDLLILPFRYDRKGSTAILKFAADMHTGDLSFKLCDNLKLPIKDIKNQKAKIIYCSGVSGGNCKYRSKEEYDAQQKK